MPITKEDWAYIAGIIDGEGSIDLGKYRNRNYFTINIVITNTDKSLINWIREKTKLGMKTWSVRGTNKPLYRWKVSKYTDALTFVKSVLPYLKVKRQQAKLILDYINIRLKKLDERYNCPIGEEEITIWKTLKKLNSGG